jgi:DNA-binding LacI/PurR family transcriptional regulator
MAPRQKAVTAGDVAKLAGVSVSAVSRTFTAGASVSEVTRTKVIDAARVLKFRPSQTVQTAYLRGSYIIGFAVAELDDIFYASVAQMLSERLAKTGHRLLLFITHGNTQLDPIHSELLRFRVDALILASTDPSFPLADACRDFRIPVIMFNSANANSETTSVAGANFVGGRQIAAFLIAGGHRRLAFLAGIENSSMNIEREAGFNSFLLSHDLPRPLRAQGHYTFEGAAQATRKLLGAKERPDAIFCVNDFTALACMQVARSEFGLEPGKNISIVGFDDTNISRWPAFDLTTYSQPLERMADRAIEMLHSMLKGTQFKSVHEVVPGELIVRSSARAPAQGIETRKDGVRVWTGAS